MQYELIWRNKWLTANATTIDEMIASLERAAYDLTELEAAGVTLRDDGNAASDYACLVTDDPEIAAQFDFDLVEEEENACSCSGACECVAQTET